MMIVDNEADLLKSVFLIKESSEPCEPFLTNVNNIVQPYFKF